MWCECVCVCVWLRERESLCVCVRARTCVRECVCEWILCAFVHAFSSTVYMYSRMTRRASKWMGLLMLTNDMPLLERPGWKNISLLISSFSFGLWVARTSRCATNGSRLLFSNAMSTYLYSTEQPAVSGKGGTTATTAAAAAELETAATTEEEAEIQQQQRMNMMNMAHEVKRKDAAMGCAPLPSTSA